MQFPTENADTDEYADQEGEHLYGHKETFADRLFVLRVVLRVKARSGTWKETN